MTDLMIKVENLSKRYRIGRTKSKPQTRREALKRKLLSPFEYLVFSLGPPDEEETLWALRDVSFEVQRGDVVGIIGPNGAGKSTLLKVLTRVTYPTSGRAVINGRVGSMLEVGTGFKPELTGRENTYMNGSILGMRKSEVDAKFDEIVAFAGVERFIDTRVKHYSSGMQVRLAFSVAVHLQTDVLIIDEVLTVGDAIFQQKSLKKIQELTRQRDRTVLFVSHSMPVIRSLCRRALVLNEGRIVFEGEPQAAITHYLSPTATSSARVGYEEIKRTAEVYLPTGEEFFEVLEVSVCDVNGSPRTDYKSNEPIVISTTFRCLQTVPQLHLGIELLNETNDKILNADSTDAPQSAEFSQLSPGTYRYQCTIPPNLFGSRLFHVTFGLYFMHVQHVTLRRIVNFTVEFQGYNDSFTTESGGAYFRPRLGWDMRRLDDNDTVSGQ